MNKQPLAIVRIAKVKGGTLDPMARHHMRSQVTPNADPARSHLNRWLEGIGDPATHVLARLDGVKRRKDAVIALEVLMTASPAFFGDGAQWRPEQIEAFQAAAMAWVRQHFGAHRVASAVLHMDETTPHIHAVVVPLINGRLRAGHWVNGRAKLQTLQTSYAEALAPLGIHRGERGSKATHSTLKRHYGQLARLRAKEAQRLRDIRQVAAYARQFLSLAEELLPYINRAAVDKLSAAQTIEQNLRILTREAVRGLMDEATR